MPSDIEEIRAVLADLIAERRKPKRRKDPRQALNFRLSPEELALVDAEARSRGVCRSDLVRIALSAVLQQDLRIVRDTPPGLKRFTIRRKPDRFDDGKTDTLARDQAIERDTAGRRAMMLTLEAQALMREHNAVALPALASERSQQGMMSDAALASRPGKLSR